ncbi:growth-regulating factor 9-like [Hibiscus syriacus]|uniref:growth-regulating factor 9-like n=1 Tax=Hibiscus syriacus TaxID=106335 RepID=UPI00192384B5|nr:growth-regulating factor 9-like [Hibiscus syriacus]
MHRGCRRRSRKPVEISKTALRDSTQAKISIELWENSKKLSAPVSSQNMNQSSCNNSTSHKTRAVTTIGSNNVCSNRKSINANAETSSTIITATENDEKNDPKRIKIVTNTSEKCEEKPSVSDGSSINRSCKSVNRVTVAHNISPTVGFSPKSVLQGNNSSSLVSKIQLELEPGRCRRTDAK